MTAALACLLLAACSTAPIGHKDLLDFLNDGVTRRDDVYLKLGEPSARFEDLRILTYRIGKDDGGYFPAGGPRGDWSGLPYSLVLVFDSSGILTRHALVEVRSR
jgi:hypothetical protein